MLEVGTGVGYFWNALDPRSPSRACFFNGRGNPGEDERGSNGGSKDGAGRFIPRMLDEEEDTGGSEGSSAVRPSMFLTGEDVMIEGQDA